MQLGQFLHDLVSLAVAALTLNPSALRELTAEPNISWLALCLVLIAGVSRLLGESVWLFINRVSRRRFGIGLLAGSVIFALELVLWAVSIWLILRVLGQSEATLGICLLILAIASAPWLFGFLVFAPYLGALLRWLLLIWSWLIALVLIREVFTLQVVPAFVVVTVGWLLLRGLETIFAPRTEAIQNRLWTRFTGTPAELSFEEQAEALAKQLREGAAT